MDFPVILVSMLVGLGYVCVRLGWRLGRLASLYFMCVVVVCTRVNNGCKGWVTVELTYVFYRIMRLVVVLVGLTVKLGCGHASIGQGMGHFASLDLWRVMAAV